ncbi:hypothetical protein B0H34DRAFT_646739 [Crassisporium funariophilum]|nr:hypothetical protein B0H34DRAFT_646739 [Crassisporium funariophilum]
MTQQSALSNDPNTLTCPDFSSEIYAQLRLMYITWNPDATDADEVLHLADSWHTANGADKIAWNVQQALDRDNEAKLERQKQEDADLAAEKLRLNQETLRQDDMKKHKAKYLPILHRDVPDQPPILANASATCKLNLGLYCKLYYWTNPGLSKAWSLAATTDNDALSLVLKDGATSLVPAAAARNSRTVKADKELTWDDFTVAIPRVIEAMERAGWQHEKVLMFAQFWTNLKNHPHASAFNTDGLLRKSLLTYQDEVCRSWYSAVASGNTQSTFNIVRINETLLLTIQRCVEYDHRAAFDKEYNIRVQVFCFTCINTI